MGEGDLPLQGVELPFVAPAHFWGVNAPYWLISSNMLLLKVELGRGVCPELSLMTPAYLYVTDSY